MIKWYRIGRRSDFISSEIPQQELDFLINTLPVRVDLTRVRDSSGADLLGVNVVYDGYTLPARLNGVGVTYVVDDLYGVTEHTDGFIYLGVKS